MRPILPSDVAAAMARMNGTSRDGLPPTPEQKMRSSSFSSSPSSLQQQQTRKQGILKESSRVDSTGGGSSAGGAWVDTDPAWEVKGNTVWQAEHTQPDPNRRNTYTFDHSFGPLESNRDVYNRTVRDTVISTMEGYHASVFAYGQTATGKTFTMTGGKGTGNIKNGEGIIQLAIRDCFDYIHNQKEETREYLLRVSFMEIYNEVIHDLLASPVKSQPMMTTSMNSSSVHNDPPPSTSIRIFESKNEGVIIRGLKEEIVTCPEQVFALLAAGERRRHTGSTGMNRHSSRSHSIFRFTVESRRRIPRQGDAVAGGGGSGGGGMSKRAVSFRSDSNATAVDSIASSTFAPASTVGPVRVSTLSLVDLAGSESVKNTGSAKARLKEGQYINKSLLTLGHVVYKLAEASLKKENVGGSSLDSVHIPYRDSKLTRLLQPSLSGNAQICIICNISPLSRHIEESHLTLKFASRAKRIKQHATITEIVDEKTLLENYREEIEELKNQLKEAKESRGNVSKASSSIDDDDIQVLSQAVSNLERLILKTTTTEEKRRRKKRREALAKMREEQGFPKTINGDNSLKSGDGDTLLNSIVNKDDDDTLLDSLSLDDNSLTKLNGEAEKVSHSIKDDHSIGGNSVGDESTILEGKNLINELHRIQGLLGGVLAKRGSTGSLNVKKNSTSPITVNSQNDVEVERLRAQLHEQTVSSSLRMADQTFLQAQLHEKDLLLKDISQILEAVEKRQVDLETENERLKTRLQNTSSELRTKESETLILEKLITKRDEEIKKLKATLDEA